MGPQGSGKSTLAVQLSEKLNLPVVDIGSLIRESCKIKTDSNKVVCEMMEKGEMVPDEYAADLLKIRLEFPDTLNGFVLDGYPRSIHQLQLFDPHIDKAIFLKVEVGTSVGRLIGRGRVDDNYEAIKKRLSWYHEKTSLVLEYYKGLDKLIEVSGEKDKMDVFVEVCEKLNL